MLFPEDIMCDQGGVSNIQNIFNKPLHQSDCYKADQQISE